VHTSLEVFFSFKKKEIYKKTQLIGLPQSSSKLGNQKKYKYRGASHFAHFYYYIQLSWANDMRCKCDAIGNILENTLGNLRNTDKHN
jgi:hypothetical protein